MCVCVRVCACSLRIVCARELERVCVRLPSTKTSERTISNQCQLLERGKNSYACTHLDGHKGEQADAAAGRMQLRMHDLASCVLSQAVCTLSQAVCMLSQAVCMLSHAVCMLSQAVCMLSQCRVLSQAVCMHASCILVRLLVDLFIKT